ncbi:Senecionine N-oxygenase [Sorochytrium milnesiophthora]
MLHTARIGVLALQGAFQEHINILNCLSTGELKIDAFAVKTRADLESGLDGLIIPGGESTTMALIAERNGIFDFLADFVQTCPTWGTCAGLILLSRNANHTKQGGQRLLNALDVVVDRNAFGSQVDSFVAPIEIQGLVKQPPTADAFPAVFIRAPTVESVGKGVQVLGKITGSHGQVHGERVVAVKQGHLLGTSFHPELTNDYRMHWYFVEMVMERKLAQSKQVL